VRAVAIGAGDNHDRIRSLAAGFTHYLAAPVEPGLLASTVAAAARDRRARQREAGSSPVVH